MIDFNRLENICEKYGAEVLKNAPLAPFTTFKIGGPCDFLIRVPNREVLQKAVLFCKETDTPFYIIGNGSNVLVRDEGIRGVVLHTGWVWEQTSVDDDSGIIICTAGTELSSLCREARNASLTGLEFAYGIPGTTGGAIYMNAGAYDGEMSHVVYEVDYLNENGEFKTMLCKDTDFDYRKSPFTATEKIITAAVFKLEQGDKAQITAKMDDFMERRKTKQPLEFPSAGSTFKRPEGDYASRLIDVCGLKGLSVGGAEVSKKHAGFIINKGGASCKDVLNLIETVKERVFKETGKLLEREVELLG